MTRRHPRLLFVALLGLSLASGACTSLFSKAPPAPSDDPIRVPHAKHAEAKVECLSCHETVYDQQELGKGDVLPPEAKCMECHKEKKEQGQCGMCHTDVKRAVSWSRVKRGDTGIIMSHAKHIERVKEDCSKCHARLPGDKATPVGKLTPTMDACRSCHEHDQQYKDGRCDVCHTDLARYPIKPVSTFTHQGNFVREHARPARAAAESCAACHEQSFCADCHARTASPRIETRLPERVDSDFIHRNDFVGRHAVEAAADPAMCRRCHGESFCTACHAAQNLARGGSDPRNPHPVGWSLPGANTHGPAARRDIARCASCHDQGPRSNCVDCHKVGGIGGNPHPPEFKERNGRDKIQTNSMCLYCHG